MTIQSHTELAARARKYADWFAGGCKGPINPNATQAAELLRQCAAALESPERVGGEVRLSELVSATEPFVKLFQQADANRDQPMDGRSSIDAQIAVKDLRRLVYAAADAMSAKPSQQEAPGAAMEAWREIKESCDPSGWTTAESAAYRGFFMHGWRAALRASTPEAVPLTDEQIEKLREQTFSTSNPFCPVDSKSMRKAVRAAEHAHGIVTKEISNGVS